MSHWKTEYLSKIKGLRSITNDLFHQMHQIGAKPVIKIIEKLSVTPANVHDSQKDLSIPGIICYRDKGYFGSECKGSNGTMDQSVRVILCWLRVYAGISEYPRSDRRWNIPMHSSRGCSALAM